MKIQAPSSAGALCKILQIPMTKKVFAFEEVFLDEPNQYIEWACNIIESEIYCDGLGVLAAFYGNNAVNHFELLEGLRKMAKSLLLCPITGDTAVGLYALGLMEDVIEDRAGFKVVVRELSSFSLERPKISCLKNIYNIYNTKWLSNIYEEITYDEVVQQCMQEMRRSVESTELQIVEIDLLFKVNIKWGDK